MKWIKRLLIFLLALIVVLTITYFLGPKPPLPTFPTATYSFQPTTTLPDLERQITESERQVAGIKPNNEARIVWADSSKKEKTKVAMLYLHGFGASHTEGYPVDVDLAKRFGCNLYLARLHEHGVELGDNNLFNFNADKYVESAERALVELWQLGSHPSTQI
jgi:hypothetical protein